MFAHRSLYHDGWRAVCPWPGHSFSEGKLFGTPLTADDLKRLDGGSWELYHVDEDASECHDVAADNRDRLIEMISLWYAEAGKYNVLPLDGRGTLRLAEQRPQLAKDRRDVRLLPAHPGGPGRARRVRVLNRPHTITADVEIPEGGAEGVLLSMGGVDGGFTLLRQGRQAALHVQLRRRRLLPRLVGRTPCPPARPHCGSSSSRPDRPTSPTARAHPVAAQLYVNRKLVGQTELPYTIPLALGLAAGVCVGRDEGSPVCDDYPAPFEFTGTIHRVTVDVSGDLIVDEEAEMKAIMARQ